MSELKKKPLFNPGGDTDIRLRRMIGGNTTNLNDFNNLRYTWVNNWYRQAMNNFWIPEEINLSQDIKDYPNLTENERTAYNKILSFLVFLDSIQLQTSRASVNTLPQTRLISVSRSRHFRNVYTARVTVICWTPSAVQ